MKRLAILLPFGLAALLMGCANVQRSAVNQPMGAPGSQNPTLTESAHEHYYAPEPAVHDLNQQIWLQGAQTAATP